MSADSAAMLDGAKSLEHLQRLARDGFTVIEGAIEPELAGRLREGLARLEREQGFGYRDTAFEGRRTLRIYNLLAHGPEFQAVPLHPAVLPVVEAALDPELLLSSLSAICLDPGQDAQPIHSDTQLIPLPRPHLPIAFNALWALDEFSRENGATRVVPGSHRFDHAPAYGQHYDSVPVEMPAGSVLIFDSQLWHGGGANLSGKRRSAIACYYCAGWIRQQENQFLGLPTETVRGFPRRLQELCGFSVYRGQYGHVDNRDPIEFLGRERRRPMVWQASERRNRPRPAE